MDMTVFDQFIPAMGQEAFFGLTVGIVLIISIALTIIKGLALFRAVKVNQKGWFWVLMFVSTFGILDLLYLFVFSKRRRK